MMRRKLVIGAISLTSFLLLLVLAAILFVRAGRLDLFLEDQIKSSLADAGVRAEIGNAHLDLSGYVVRLTGVKLFTEEGQKPFGSIENIEAKFSVVSYLQQ